MTREVISALSAKFSSVTSVRGIIDLLVCMCVCMSVDLFVFLPRRCGEREKGLGVVVVVLWNVCTGFGRLVLVLLCFPPVLTVVFGVAGKCSSEACLGKLQRVSALKPSSCSPIPSNAASVPLLLPCYSRCCCCCFGAAGSARGSERETGNLVITSSCSSRLFPGGTAARAVLPCNEVYTSYSTPCTTVDNTPHTHQER